MAGDVKTAGYARFFTAFCLFVFSMACLVMGDNLLLLYLGWEGVGLCSYLLIGYFYTKPSAVAAAKKAFIMNRIGDLGLALGIMLTYVHFGTIEYAKLFPLVQPYLELAQHGHLDEVPWVVQTIPVLFTIGAFGKSAQIPLYVWLPDAMEGPTPVSALIHAATMVTAGVYLVARFLPMYICSGWALPMVAWGGALTALLAATIGMAQFDIKRIMAYSTVSQLGYMFAGLGVLGATGGAGHVFTHAFFKALLFLACGAVMHGFAGQLDLRKLSGLSRMKGWKVVSITMLIGCLNLAGFPFITAGFWTKDSIIGDAFASPRFEIVGWILLITAALTAYYTFRVFFRVFVGPAHFEPGDEGLGDDAHAQAEHDAKHDHQGGHRGPEPQVEETEAGAQLARAGVHQEQGHGQRHGDGFHPHPPGWAINLVLALLAVATFAAVPLVSHMLAGHDTWLSRMVGGSTAGADGPHGEHGTFLGMDAHTGAMYASIVGAILGILIAAYLHGPRGLGGLFIGSRTSAAVSRADGIRLGPLARGARHKWYVDELYHSVFVVPLRVLGHVFHAIDKLIVDGLVNLFGSAPRFMAHGARRTQTGVLHDYALRMAGGLALIVLVVWFIHSGPDMGSPEAPPPAPEAHAAIQAGVGR
jgi:NADH-quinone oxidoreductase subunit L